MTTIYKTKYPYHHTTRIYTTPQQKRELWRTAELQQKDNDLAKRGWVLVTDRDNTGQRLAPIALSGGKPFHSTLHTGHKIVAWVPIHTVNVDWE